MATGLVFYADDPERKIFRKVFLAPGEPDLVLDDPYWVTFGCDPKRIAVLIKVPTDDPRALAPMTGVP